MQTALRFKTRILPGGKVEVSHPQLLPGEDVEVIILRPEVPSEMRRSALDILADAAGQRVFKTAQDVDEYLQGERNSWDD